MFPQINPYLGISYFFVNAKAPVSQVLGLMPHLKQRNTTGLLEILDQLLDFRVRRKSA